MDRLEKALEKSRQQRAFVEQSYSSPNQPSELSKTAPAHVSPTADPDQIDEYHMEQNRILAHHVRSHQADIYRQLRTQVLQIMQKNGYRTLAITSPQYGDGKTTIALNLGISMALDVKQTVLLVDLDLRKPNLHEYLGAHPQAGLTDYLLNDAPIAECLMRPPFERVNVLPAGRAFNNSSELLGSPRMAELAHELKTRYPDRIVIYDMPPTLAQDDPLAFVPHVDAVLVVVRDGVTRADDLKRCLRILSNANVIGTVLNNCW